MARLGWVGGVVVVRARESGIEWIRRRCSRCRWCFGAPPVAPWRACRTVLTTSAGVSGTRSQGRRLRDVSSTCHYLPPPHAAAAPSASMPPTQPCPPHHSLPSGPRVPPSKQLRAWNPLSGLPEVDRLGLAWLSPVSRADAPAAPRHARSLVNLLQPQR